MSLPPEVQEFLDSISVLQFLIWIAATVGIVILIRKSWPTVSKFVRTIDVILELAERLARIERQLGDQDELLERVRAQVENDHDTNMREELTEALEWQQKHEKKSDAVIARVAALEQKEKRSP